MHTCPPPIDELEERFDQYASVNENFGHILLLQKTADDGTLAEALKPYFESAHLDARTVFHKFIGIDLHPDADSDASRAEYPRCLPCKTRRGLFGEVMAGLVTESYKLEFVGRHRWCVPIFLFSHHVDAQNYLYNLARNQGRIRQVFGRPGSDFIGLLLDSEGAVIRFIAGEAKWRMTLNKSGVDVMMYGEKIDDQEGGEQKVHNGKGVWRGVNNDSPVPIGVRQLAGLLEHHDPDLYGAAILSMESALLRDNPEDLPRTDLIIILGNGRAGREKLERLLPFKEMPDDYKAGNDLQLVEVVMKEGTKLIDAIYDSLWTPGEPDA